MATHQSREMKNTAEIEAWLEYTVGYGQYCDLFIINGYDNFRTVKTIESTQDLLELGITSLEHREKIMNFIRKLKEDDDNEKKQNQNHGYWGSTGPASDREGPFARNINAMNRMQNNIEQMQSVPGQPMMAQNGMMNPMMVSMNNMGNNNNNNNNMNNMDNNIFTSMAPDSSDDEMYSNENGADEVKGYLVISEVKECGQCQATAAGKKDDDGIFYCNECWKDWVE